MSTGLPRWRSGVILQFESCQALVKGDVQERKVWISVAGPVRGPAQPAGKHSQRFRAHSRRHQEAAAAGHGAGGRRQEFAGGLLGTQEALRSEQKKTEGIQITPWSLKLNGEEVRLHVWDFGGQEIMHATHQFFLTERSLYLLVLNGREGGEDADADYWLRLIESFGGNSPVIVVLNKIKEHPFDLNRRALEQKYVGIREFVSTDCEDSTGIDELRRAIEREADRLEDLRVKFPTAWFAIKDRLAGMQTNYLDFDEYRKECEQLGEREAEAQERLAGFLHSLGIVLNFRDDTRLTDTHVLNLDWVTSGIYTVLKRPPARGAGRPDQRKRAGRHTRQADVPDQDARLPARPDAQVRPLLRLR
jgi:hypothetical protein